MKTMMIADFCTTRKALGQMAGILVVAGVVMACAMGTVVGAVAAVGAMVPFMYLFTIGAFDEQNGWERFRLTLPLTRRQVVFGRYGTVFVVAVTAAVGGMVLGLGIEALAGAMVSAGLLDGMLADLTLAANPPVFLVSSSLLTLAVFFLGAAVALPLMARFGMTKASRFVPLVVVLVMAAFIGLLDPAWLAEGALGEVASWVAADESRLVLIVLAGALVAFAVYVASALVAAKLYERREF